MGKKIRKIYIKVRLLKWKNLSSLTSFSVILSMVKGGREWGFDDVQMRCRLVNSISLVGNSAVIVAFQLSLCQMCLLLRDIEDNPIHPFQRMPVLKYVFSQREMFEIHLNGEICTLRGSKRQPQR